MGGHSYASRGTMRYHSYVCETVQKQGAAACPGGRIPAPEMDAFVVSKIRAIANDPGILRNAISADRKRLERRPTLEAELLEAESTQDQLDEEQPDLIILSVTSQV